MSGTAALTGEPMPLLTDSEIDDIARGVIRGDICLDEILSIDGTGQVAHWTIFALTGPADIPVNASALVWEHNHKAGPFAINGRPTFLSMHLIPVENAPDVLDRIDALETALEQA